METPVISPTLEALGNDDSPQVSRERANKRRSMPTTDSSRTTSSKSTKARLMELLHEIVSEDTSEGSSSDEKIDEIVTGGGIISFVIDCLKGVVFSDTGSHDLASNTLEVIVSISASAHTRQILTEEVMQSCIRALGSPLEKHCEQSLIILSNMIVEEQEILGVVFRVWRGIGNIVKIVLSLGEKATTIELRDALIHFVHSIIVSGYDFDKDEKMEINKWLPLLIKLARTSEETSLKNCCFSIVSILNATKEKIGELIESGSLPIIIGKMLNVEMLSSVNFLLKIISEIGDYGVLKHLMNEALLSRFVSVLNQNGVSESIIQSQFLALTIIRNMARKCTDGKQLKMFESTEVLKHLCLLVKPKIDFKDHNLARMAVSALKAIFKRRRTLGTRSEVLLKSICHANKFGLEKNLEELESHSNVEMRKSAQELKKIITEVVSEPIDEED